MEASNPRLKVFDRNSLGTAAVEQRPARIIVDRPDSPHSIHSGHGRDSGRHAVTVPCIIYTSVARSVLARL